MWCNHEHIAVFGSFACLNFLRCHIVFLPVIPNIHLAYGSVHVRMEVCAGNKSLPESIAIFGSSLSIVVEVLFQIKSFSGFSRKDLHALGFVFEHIMHKEC